MRKSKTLVELVDHTDGFDRKDFEVSIRTAKISQEDKKDLIQALERMLRRKGYDSNWIPLI